MTGMASCGTQFTEDAGALSRMMSDDDNNRMLIEINDRKQKCDGYLIQGGVVLIKGSNKYRAIHGQNFPLLSPTRNQSKLFIAMKKLQG